MGTTSKEVQQLPLHYSCFVRGQSYTKPRSRCQAWQRLIPKTRNNDLAVRIHAMSEVWFSTLFSSVFDTDSRGTAAFAMPSCRGLLCAVHIMTILRTLFWSLVFTK